MCLALGLPHETLVWEGEKPTTAVQAEARNARYALLSELARRGAAARPAIVTAHTLDDQAETVLMRLARGSGIDGLAGMPRVGGGPTGGAIDVVRPLLGLRKPDLESWLRSKGLSWSEDPSNTDERFERVRVRRLWPELAAAGFDAERLALTARRMARAREALELATDRLLADAVDVNEGAFARIELRRFFAAAPELRIRLLVRLLAAFGGDTPPATLAEVERLAAVIEGRGPMRLSLGGCLIRALEREVHVFRELGRIQAPVLELAEGDGKIWDGRFRVEWKRVSGVGRAASPHSLKVRPLDPKVFAALRKSLRLTANRLPAHAAATLPAFWDGDRLLWVSGLDPEGVRGFCRGEAADLACRAEFIGLGRP